MVLRKLLVRCADKQHFEHKRSIPRCPGEGSQINMIQSQMSFVGEIHDHAVKSADRQSLRLQVAASGAPEDTPTELFELAKDESLVDTFVCKLQQSYCCSHNSYTPPVQMTYACTLSITDRHACFAVKESERDLPFKLPHAAVRSAGLSGELQALLTIQLKDGMSVVLGDFEGSDAASNALALVEHLAGL